MTDPRYPIGHAEKKSVLSDAERRAAIDTIAATPGNLRLAVAGLTSEQLDTPYRDGGWTVRQVVHHVPDSHMNAYVRFKLALTEDEPLIKPYEEDRWARLADSQTTPIEVSLILLETVHNRWDTVLRAMSGDDFQRTLKHPDLGILTLDRMLCIYSWHGRHHVAHVTALRERMGW
jgi:DinB superfamily